MTRSSRPATFHGGEAGTDRADGVGRPDDAGTPDRRTSPRTERVRAIGRVVLAVAYFVAGVFHLRATDGFAAIVPHWVPAPTRW